MDKYPYGKIIPYMVFGIIVAILIILGGLVSYLITGGNTFPGWGIVVYGVTVVVSILVGIGFGIIGEDIHM